jgi:hypothetical protein
MLMVAKDRKDLVNVDAVDGPVAKSLEIDSNFVVKWFHWKDDDVVVAVAVAAAAVVVTAAEDYKDGRKVGML